MNNNKYFFSLVFFLSLYISLNVAYAAPLETIPSSLKEWKNWVLYSEDKLNCPENLSQHSRHCIWPGRLDITLDTTQQLVYFSQPVTVFGNQSKKYRVDIVGGAKAWPQSVKVNQQEIVVLEANKQAYVLLAPGKYQINGQITWFEQLQSIPLPQDVILVDYFQQQQELRHAKSNFFIDQNNVFWFKNKPKTIKKVKKQATDHLEVKVFRRLIDDIPPRIESHYRLSVSGQRREVMIDALFPEGFVSHSYSSQLPARLIEANTISLQLKPGVFTFKVTARSLKPLAELEYFSHQSKLAFMPKSEIWVFKDNQRLQHMIARADHQIDSSPTLMPSSWKSQPAFLMKPNTKMVFTLQRRGNETPAPNKLKLNRKIWLDFTGKGLSVQDTISGTITKDSRLEVLAQMKPGKVVLNNKPQRISTLSTETDGHAGVEVRAGNISLTAESRLKQSVDSLSISGWREDFNQVSSTVFLPPGWSIFHAIGVDKISKTWINKWTLLDIFKVLLLAIIFYKIWGKLWGGIALLGFVVMYHRGGAPDMVWFHLVIATALISFLGQEKFKDSAFSQGKFYRFLKAYKFVALAVLVIGLIPFWITELRENLYPQLNVQSYQLNKTTSTVQNQARMKSNNRVVADMAMEMAAPASIRGLSKKSYQSSNVAETKEIVEYDENSKIQMGVGLPSWQFNSTRLNWNAPVSQKQQFQLYLISPFINLILTIFMIGLSAALVYRVIDFKRWRDEFAYVPLVNIDKNNSNNKEENSIKPESKKVLSLLFTGILSLSLLSPEVSQDIQANTDQPSIEQFSTKQASIKQADYPPKYLLDELKSRLLQKSPCYPNCLSIEKMHIHQSGQELVIRLMVHSQVHQSLTLPIDKKSVIIEQVNINEEPIEQFLRKQDSREQLIQIPISTGKQDVIVKAKLLTDTLVMPLNQSVHHITHQLENWSISGLNQLEPQSQRLILQKNPEAINKEPVTTSTTADVLEQVQDGVKINGFFKINRRFHFAQEWMIETTISRISDKNSAHNKAQVFYYPLLEGESVLTHAKKVKNQTMMVNLAPSQHHFYWRSRLDKKTELKLIAANETQWIDEWEIFSGTQWHIKTKDLAPVQSKHPQPENRGRARSSSILGEKWRPWPGESLNISIERPTTFAGQTKAITHSNQHSTIGDRLIEHRLNFQVEASQSEQYQITLPQNSRLMSLKVNHQTQLINEKESELTFPVIAGKTPIEVTWRESTEDSLTHTIKPANLGMNSVNHHINVKVPDNHLVVYVSKATIGPVVLFWGMLAVLLIISFIVSKIPGVPLTSTQAMLLAIGVAPVSIEALLVIYAWFIIMSRRSLVTEDLPKYFNLMQIVLVGLTFVTVAALLVSIESSLLGYPNFYLTGNGSSGHLLKWYFDQWSAAEPDTYYVAIPIFYYRLLMLIWALWLASRFVSWGTWGWKQYSHITYWKKIVLPKPSGWGRKKIVKQKQEE